MRGDVTYITSSLIGFRPCWVIDKQKQALIPTSRPAIQWKKYSCGRIPVRKRPSMKPPARGHMSKGWKDGKERPLSISGGRWPSNSIWPSKHEICMQFTWKNYMSGLRPLLYKVWLNRVTTHWDTEWMDNTCCQHQSTWGDDVSLIVQKWCT